MDGIWIAVVGVIIAVVVFSLMRLGPSVNCPNCGSPLPRQRKPNSLRQLLWGGWTCSNCGSEVDRRGRPIQAERRPESGQS